MTFCLYGCLEVDSHCFYVADVKMTVWFWRKSESFDSFCNLQMFLIDLFWVALFLEDSWTDALNLVPKEIVRFGDSLATSIRFNTHIHFALKL